MFFFNIYSCTTVPRRNFSAGVTSLLSDVHREHVLSSGSYDENIQSWDNRNMKTPSNNINMGGGVWRIRQIPSKDEQSYSQLIAVACMHGGFKLVDIVKMQVATTYSEHESLAYGIDIKLAKNSKEIVLASCSFYDHLLKIWNASSGLC